MIKSELVQILDSYLSDEAKIVIAENPTQHNLWKLRIILKGDLDD